MDSVVVVEESYSCCQSSDEHIVPCSAIPSASSPSGSSIKFSSSSDFPSAGASKSKKRSCNRSLYALDHRKRMKKVSARRVKVAKNSLKAVSSLKLRKWKAKVDRKHDQKITERLELGTRLKAENQALLQTARTDFMTKCQELEEATRAMRVQAENRQRLEIISILSALLPQSALRDLY